MKEPQSLLQRFFDASLIPSDTTDERLAHYQAAATDLAKRFSETPRDAVSASRVAIDPNCPAIDPWFNTVQDAVKVHWKTFLAKNHDAPRQICRAILLEALSKASEEDWTATLAIWNACSNLLPHLGEGPEQAITREFFSGLGDECETHSSSEWRTGEIAAENLPEFEIKLPPIQVTQVDQAELTKGFSDAAGPNNQQSESFGNPNPHWPNQAQNWAWQFAPRAASAVAASVNKALAATSPAIKGLSDQLAPALKKHAKVLGKWVIGSVQRNERFTALLWWKQALYSPKLRRSYRELSPAGTVIALSFDLGSVSGAPVPLSVEYFLRESIRNVLPEDSKLTLAELITAVKINDEIEPCLPPAPSGSPHRISLREFFSIVRQGVPPDELISCYTGIVASTSLPVSEWAVWLLRERLAEILTAPEAQK
jgi:hypothetical protein